MIDGITTAGRFGVVVLVLWLYLLTVAVVVHFRRHAFLPATEPEPDWEPETADAEGPPENDTAANYGPLPPDETLAEMVPLVEQIRELTRDLESAWAVNRDLEALVNAARAAGIRFQHIDGKMVALNLPRLDAADRLAYAIADATVSPCIGEFETVLVELGSYLDVGKPGGPNSVREWMEQYKRTVRHE